MGYTTEFEGQFNLDHCLSPMHDAYLRAFSSTRRMKRDNEKLNDMPDPIRKIVGLPFGVEGEYFVGGTGSFGQDHDASILEYNEHPKTQPGLWCQWVPTDDGCGIEWDGGEKFYAYVEWLEYLIVNILKPWGYTLNGEVTWQGEESNDRGKIIITDNLIKTKRGRIVYMD